MSVPKDIDSKRPRPPMAEQRGRPRAIGSLVNARLMAIQWDSFEVPSDAALKSLGPGDFVKLCRNSERFWVRIDGYIGRKWHGTVANDTLLNDDLKYGDSIFFMRKNIYDTINGPSVLKGSKK